LTRLASADTGALGFAEQLLTLLREGRFTATYKYAVILALMDLCLEHSTRSGAAPSSVTTRQLAEKIIELYWTHSIPFRGGSILRQNAGGQAHVLTSIARFRERLSSRVGGSLDRARRAEPKHWERLVRDVEWSLVEMPLPKLQRLGRDEARFIYEIGWSDDVRKRDLRSSDFDNLIRFVGQSGDHFVRLSALLRPLVCREWAARVARLNEDVIEDPELDRFLFGADRSSLTPVRGPLRELQDGRCFYCDDRLSRGSQVDHFVPWTRYPDNGLDNLVVAHSGCNGAKRDHLAAIGHVRRWLERSEAASGDLETIASEAGWPQHSERTLAVARSIYLRLPEEARLWKLADEFVPSSQPDLRAAFRAT